MSGTRWRLGGYSALAVGGLFAVLAGAAPLAAQAPRDDGERYIDRVRRMQEVAAQKMEADVKADLAEASRLARTEPDEAARYLRRTLRNLQDDTALTDARRQTLVRIVRARIRLLDAIAGRAPAAVQTPPSAVRQVRQADAGRQATEHVEIRRTLDAVRAAQRDGRPEDARRYAEDLARRYPDSPAAQSASRTAAAIANMTAARGQRADYDRRLAGVSRDLERTATPPAGDMDFPADWKERTKNRSSTVQLTEKEKKIMNGLGTPVDVNFQGGHFEDVINWLSDKAGVPILLDRSGLEDSGVNYDTPINLKQRGLTLRTVLRQILGQFNLTYVIKGEAIQVTTTLRAKDLMVVRSYYIGDLLGVNSPLGGLPFGAMANQIQINQQVAQIIDLIKTSVDPTSWEGNHGSGSITYHPATGSLVIKQSAEVHAMLAGGLR